MPFTWNLVTKNFAPTKLLRHKIEQKLYKLDRHIQHFPADAVHLLVTLARHPRKPQFQAGLTLRLPSNPLRSEKSAADPIPAFDQAFKALLREIASLKAELRGEKTWKHKGRRARLRQQKPARFAGLPGPPAHALAAQVRAQLQAEQPRLVQYIQRQLWRARLEGRAPAGTIEPQEIADEVARQLESDSEPKPPTMSDRVWFYHLARRELNRQMKALRIAARENVPVELETAPAGSARGANRADREGNFASIPAPLGDRIVDPRAMPPDESAAQHEFLEFLHRQAATWPDRERAVLELHFLEEFELDEVGMLENLKLPEVEQLRHSVQERLRTLLRAATQTVARSRPTKAPEFRTGGSGSTGKSAVSS